MIETDLKDELVRFALSIRPSAKPFVSLVDVAHTLGIVVVLQLQDVSLSETAQIDLRSQPPKIIVYRFNKLKGEREVNKEEEALLTPRERFSIAHELGHWLIFSHFQLGPQSDERLYWKQEEAVNFFAGHLLVPDRLAEEWLNESGPEEPLPISPFALRYWAERSMVSEEVIAKALARYRASIGFLKLLPTRRKRDGTSVLQVLSCAQGDGISLPNERAFIESQELRSLIMGGKIGTTTWFSGIRLGRCKPQNLGMAWRRGNRFRSEDTIWLSLIKGEKPASRQEPMNLLLFG